MNMLIDEPLIVMLHGWVWSDDGESQEHCDYDYPLADGWNVWVRKNHDKPNEDGEPFGSIEFFDTDLYDYEEAQNFAVEVQEALEAITGTKPPLDMY